MSATGATLRASCQVRCWAAGGWVLVGLTVLAAAGVDAWPGGWPSAAVAGVTLGHLLRRTGRLGVVVEEDRVSVRGFLWTRRLTRSSLESLTAAPELVWVDRTRRVRRTPPLVLPPPADGQRRKSRDGPPADPVAVLQGLLPEVAPRTAEPLLAGALVREFTRDQHVQGPATPRGAVVGALLLLVALGLSLSSLGQELLLAVAGHPARAVVTEVHLQSKDKHVRVQLLPPAAPIADRLLAWRGRPAVGAVLPVHYVGNRVSVVQQDGAFASLLILLPGAAALIGAGSVWGPLLPVLRRARGGVKGDGRL